MQKNVFGEPLELCGLDPVTGYFREVTLSAQLFPLNSSSIKNPLEMTFQRQRRSLDLLA